MAVTKDNEKREIYVPDLGVTLRTIMGVAAEGYKDTANRRWFISYKGVQIGSVQVKDTHLKPARGPARPRKRESGEEFAAQFCEPPEKSPRPWLEAKQEVKQP